MYNEKFAKLVHQLVKNPQEREKFLNGKASLGVSCNSIEHKALTNVFSQQERIMSSSVVGIVPMGYWM